VVDPTPPSNDGNPDMGFKSKTGCIVVDHRIVPAIVVRSHVGRSFAKEDPTAAFHAGLKAQPARHAGGKAKAFEAFGLQPDDDHLVGVRGKSLPTKPGAPDLVGGLGDSSGQIKAALVTVRHATVIERKPKVGQD